MVGVQVEQGGSFGGANGLLSLSEPRLSVHQRFFISRRSIFSGLSRKSLAIARLLDADRGFLLTGEMAPAISFIKSCVIETPLRAQCTFKSWCILSGMRKWIGFMAADSTRIHLDNARKKKGGGGPDFPATALG